MEQKKIEHITLHLIVFGTLAIIGVLARQTVLHYGWDEFSSYLILVVCTIIMGAIYLNLQMVFRQLLSPAIEKCFMRFECYRNKAVVIEVPTVNSELAGSAIDSEPIIFLYPLKSYLLNSNCSIAILVKISKTEA